MTNPAGTPANPTRAGAVLNPDDRAALVDSSHSRVNALIRAAGQRRTARRLDRKTRRAARDAGLIHRHAEKLARLTGEHPGRNPMPKTQQAHATWSGPRSPSTWSCPSCTATAEPDPEHPGALIISHRADCRSRTGSDTTPQPETGS